MSREVFDKYERNLARDRAGYAYRGYLVRDLGTAWDDSRGWQVSKEGYNISVCNTRKEAHAAIDMLA